MRLLETLPSNAGFQVLLLNNAEEKPSQPQTLNPENVATMNFHCVAAVIMTI